jgi:hypothetical protein
LSACRTASTRRYDFLLFALGLKGSEKHAAGRNRQEMTMKWFFSTLLLSALLGLSTAKAQSIDWPLVARAQVIVAGTATPLGLSEGGQDRRTLGLQAFKIENPSCLKKQVGSWSLNNCNGPVVFLAPADGPAPPQTPSIFFLSEIDLGPGQQEVSYRLTQKASAPGYVPLSDQAVIDVLRIVVENATAVEAAHPRETTEDPFAEDNQSARLVKGFLAEISATSTDAERQKRALDELVSVMGFRALIYLVYYVDDLRPFPAKSLTVELKGPNGEFRDVTFHPEAMVDAIDILLLRIEQMLEFEDGLRVHDRFLTDNPSRAARRNAAKAWRTHFGRLKLESTIVD